MYVCGALIMYLMNGFWNSVNLPHNINHTQLDTDIYEEIARKYATIGDYDLLNYYQELADKSKPVQ